MSQDQIVRGQVVVIFGSTGTAGVGVTHASLADPRVSEVRAVTRRPLGLSHAKLREVHCTDFANLDAIADQLEGVDCCLYCLGTSVRNVSGEYAYREIHETYPLAAARALLEGSPDASFVYLSGAGAKRSSRMMWARVKAEAENRLAGLELERLASVRPPAILPVRPAGATRWLLVPLVRVIPALGIRAVDLGRAMLRIGLDRNWRGNRTLENRDLKALLEPPDDGVPNPGSSADSQEAGAGVASALQPVAAVAFAVGIAWLGGVHLIFGEELQRMIPVWPDRLPGRPIWAHAAGLALMAGGVLMCVGRRVLAAAVTVAGVALLAVLGSQLPRALPTGMFGDAWLNVFKWLTMAAAPLVAADAILNPAPARATTSDAPPPPGWLAVAARVAPGLLAVFMIGSAVLHVRHAELVSQLMQPWLPARLFWTHLAAAALAAGGIGLLVPRVRVLAGLLTGAMIGSWFFLVHTPRMLIDPTGPVGWSEMAESLAFASLAVLLAARSARAG